MIIIALVSPTGGAGRTSLAIAAASHLCMLGRKVTLVQADPANNIEFQLGYAQASPNGLGQALLQLKELNTLVATTTAGFKLLPFGQLTLTEQLAVDQMLMEQPENLTALFRHAQFEDDGVVIVDCRPATVARTLGAENHGAFRPQSSYAGSRLRLHSGHRPLAATPA